MDRMLGDPSRRTGVFTSHRESFPQWSSHGLSKLSNQSWERSVPGFWWKGAPRLAWATKLYSTGLSFEAVAEMGFEAVAEMAASMSVVCAHARSIPALNGRTVRT